MNHMIIAVIVSLLASSNGFAEKGGTKAFDDELAFLEWRGPEAFAKHLASEKVDPCEFLIDAETQHQKTQHVVRRILLSLGYSTCQGKNQMAEKYLKSNDPLLREAAIRLASSLHSDQRREIASKIKKLKATDRDPAVVSAISDFFQTK